MEPCAPPKGDKIRERISTESVRAMESSRHLPRGEKPTHGGLLGLRVDLHPAHDVVRGGPYFHWLFGDVNSSQLLELMVHARELFLDLFRGPP